ncbi:hypothetical protein M3Y99_01851300 [Aphelenchoides fujianensis]|nr:hypothetical protein M3Y99_01851300 [Aphelenchoides fujianensis]
MLAECGDVISALFRSLLDWRPKSMEWSLLGLSTKLYWSARTSGVILVAGVGSYCAYRIFARYVGKEFVWTMLDAARLGSLEGCKADIRLLHPAGEGFLTAHLAATTHEQQARERLNRLLHSTSADDVESFAPSECPSTSSLNERRSVRYRLLSTRSGSPVRVICAANPLLRRALQQQSTAGTTADDRKASRESHGLSAIRRSRSRTNVNPSTAVSTRATMAAANDEDDRLSCSGRSDLTSVSRMQPPPAAVRTDCRCYDVDGDLLEEDDDERSGWSQRSSAASASSFVRHDQRRTGTRRSVAPANAHFLIGSVAPSTIGDEPSWDDEFASTAAVNPLFRPSTPSDISEMSAVKNLEAMLAAGHPHSRTPSLIFPAPVLEADDSMSGCGTTQNLAELIQSKCSVEGTSYMYRSCHLEESAMDTLSMVSGHSAMSTDALGGKHRSHGLWELTSRPTPEKNPEAVDLPGPSTLQPPALMTESFASRSSGSSGVARSQRKSAMFDSAIGTDVLSSDDDKSSVHVLTAGSSDPAGKHPSSQQESENTGGKASKRVRSRTWLDKINEKPSPQRFRTASIASSSVAPSVQSLEWFEEAPVERGRETEL